MDFFGAAQDGEAKKALLLKICHTYTTMIKLGTFTLAKNDNHLTQHLSSADISIFLRKSANFALSRNTDRLYFGT